MKMPERVWIDHDNGKIWRADPSAEGTLLAASGATEYIRADLVDTSVPTNWWEPAVAKAHRKVR
jgi:hypothetical protein